MKTSYNPTASDPDPSDEYSEGKASIKPIVTYEMSHSVRSFRDGCLTAPR